VGKNKLSKFAEMEHFSNLLQPTWEELVKGSFPFRGKWGSDFFRNGHPIVAELGCGKGEYTVTLAGLHPGRNYIGLDIKGARMYTGAREALQRPLPNVAFIRTKIENTPLLFGPGEISALWLTFPDPQLKKVRKRLTSTFFIGRYLSFLKPGGTIHLKTDSIFMYQYTSALVRLNGFEILADTADLYATEPEDEVLSIRTFYEKQWLDRGIPVKYLAFRPSGERELLEPGEDFEKEAYRSFGRSART
jgi:tRNA (guanine-N7-)-methyltransferase